MGADPSLLEKTFQAERRIAAVRVIVVASGFVLYPWLEFTGAVPDTLPWLAWTLLVAAAVYGVFVWRAEPYRRFPVMLSAYFLSATDSAFTMLWLYATGGFHSPFYVALYMAIVGIAFRFRLRQTLFATAAYAGLYVLLLAVLGQLVPYLAQVGVRVAYIGLAALMGAVVSNEVLDQTRAKARMEQRMVEAQRSEASGRRLLDKIKRQEALLAESQALAHLGSWEWDTSRNEIQWSDELCRIFGVEPEAAPRTYEEFLDFVYPADRDALKEAVGGATRTGRAYDLDHRIVRPDGSLRWTRSRATARLGRDGRVVRLGGTAQDITKQRKAEKAAERAREQRAEIERLEELNRFKTEFLNIAAHELSTPLTPLRLQLAVLSDRLDEMGPQKRRHAVEILDRNVQRVITLVGDLLEAARIQSGRIELEVAEVDVGRLVRDCAEAFAASAADHGVVLEHTGPGGGPVTGRGDPKRLRQVLDNLVSNALKFTPEGGRIVISYEIEGPDVVVQVADTGLGLTPAQRGRLFEPFSQVQGPIRTGPAGTGLGLFISRRFAQLHGGTVTAASDGAGKGSRFMLRWPRAGPGARAAHEAAVSDRPLAADVVASNPT